MMTASIRNAALALSAGAMTIAMPAAAAPAAHSAAWAQSAPVYGDMTYAHGRDDDRRDRGRHRGWYKQDRNDRYDRYDRRDYRDYRDRYGNQGRPYYQNYPSNYGERVDRNTRVWRGDDGRYYCRKSNGTTGLLIGAGVGALLGREVVGRGGDRTLGAILGAAGGALLGRSLDSGTRCG